MPGAGWIKFWFIFHRGFQVTLMTDGEDVYDKVDKSENKDAVRTKLKSIIIIDRYDSLVKRN